MLVQRLTKIGVWLSEKKEKAHHHVVNLHIKTDGIFHFILATLSV
jgi:hypothetical protein